MSSVICSNLDQSKILSSGNGLILSYSKCLQESHEQIKNRHNRYLLIGWKYCGKRIKILVFSEHFDSLPNDKILALTKLKAFADDKFNVAKIMISFLDRVEKQCGKRRKCWFSAFSLSQYFLKSSLFQGH